MRGLGEKKIRFYVNAWVSKLGTKRYLQLKSEILKKDQIWKKSLVSIFLSLEYLWNIQMEMSKKRLFIQVLN